MERKTAEKKEGIQMGGSKRLQGAMTEANTRSYCRLI